MITFLRIYYYYLFSFSVECSIIYIYICVCVCVCARVCVYHEAVRSTLNYPRVFFFDLSVKRGSSFAPSPVPRHNSRPDKLDEWNC
jgi:hypothetical protein